MPCYFGAKTNGNKIAYALFGACLLSTTVLIITGRVGGTNCSNKYYTCANQANGQDQLDACWDKYIHDRHPFFNAALAGILIGVLSCAAILSFLVCCSRRPETYASHDVEATIITAQMVDPKAALSAGTDGKPWNTPTYPAATGYAAQDYTPGYPQAPQGYPQQTASYPAQPGAYPMNVEQPRQA